MVSNFDSDSATAPHLLLEGNFDGDDDVDITDFILLAVNFSRADMVQLLFPNHPPWCFCFWISAAACSVTIANRGDGTPDRQTLDRYPTPSPLPDSCITAK